MKKFISMLILTAFCAAQLASCNSVDLPMDNSGDTTSTIISDSEESADTSNAASTDVIIDTSSESTANSSADVIVDSGADSSETIRYTTTDDYSYVVTLTEEEINCINAGADGKYMILVNKTNKLPDDYVPEELVDIRDTRKDRAPEKMTKTAEIALHAFLNEAARYGYSDITVTSGYRTLAKQQSLYNNYVNNEIAKGKDRESAVVAADKYSARPGTSEHHTGLAADMHNFPAASQSFGYTDTAKWLAENAHRFGFILRYPPDNDDEPTFNEVTTYIWEPWHFRFVGIHYATEIYESGLCFEEYLAANSEAEVG